MDTDASYSLAARPRKRSRYEDTNAYDSAKHVPFDCSQTLYNSVLSFIASYRERNSHCPSSAPNIISVPSLLDALHKNFGVDSFQELFNDRDANPLTIPSISEIHYIHDRLWTFCACYFASHGIHTLYECYCAYLSYERVDEFSDLQIGTSFRHTDAVQAFYGVSDTLYPISTKEILQHLQLYERHLSQENRYNGALRLDRDEFIEYLCRHYSQTLEKHVDIADVGVVIQSHAFGNYISMLRRLAWQEKKELKALELEFQKGIAEKVFQLTKEKFSSANREKAIENCLSEQQKRWDTDRSQKRKVRDTQRNDPPLSLQILRRVTSVDAFLDDELARAVRAYDQAENRNSLAFVSEEIAKKDLKLRKKIDSCLKWTQKSCQYSRIKALTWVLCGMLAKIHTMLVSGDSVSKWKLCSDMEVSDLQSKDSEGEECACCCIQKEFCSCSCICECHASSSEESEEIASEDPSKRCPGDMEKRIHNFLERYQFDQTNRGLHLSDQNSLMQFLCALEAHISGSNKESFLQTLQAMLANDASLLTNVVETTTETFSLESDFVAQYVRYHNIDKITPQITRDITEAFKEQFGYSLQNFNQMQALQSVFSLEILQLHSKAHIVHAKALNIPRQVRNDDTLCDVYKVLRSRLENCPFLTNVQDFLYWNVRYRSICGPFLPFLTAEMQLFQDRNTIFLHDCQGFVFKLPHPILIQPQNLSECFQDSNASISGRALASILSTLLIKYRGTSELPHALITSHLQCGLRDVRPESLNALLLSFSLTLPLSFCPILLPFTMKIAASIVDSTEFALYQAMGAIANETEELACMERIGMCSDSFDSFQKSPLPVTFPVIVNEAFVSENEDQVSSKVNHAAMDTDECKAFVAQIQSSYSLTSAPSSIQKALQDQQQRLGRALERLSTELYACDSHFIFELLQNSDDATFSSQTTPICRVTFESEKIKFQSNEMGFSSSDIAALCDIGASTKEHSKKSIGHKGIGFKSVFRVTDTPQIHSNGFHIEFKAEKTKNCNPLRHIFPHWIEDPSRWIKDAGTNVVLFLHAQALLQRERIQASISKLLKPQILLFLRQIRQIQYVDAIHQRTRSVLKERLWASKVDDVRYAFFRLKTCDSASILHENWLTIQKKLRVPNRFRGIQKNACVSIALPLSDTNVQSYDVYSFLPIRSYGFNFIIQSDFVLPSARESIDAENEWNQWLFTQIPSLFAHAAKHLFTDDIRALNEGKDLLQWSAFCSLLPVESRIQIPFQSVAQEILSAIQRIQWLPSKRGALLAPLDLLDCHKITDKVSSDAAIEIEKCVQIALLKDVLRPDVAQSISKSVRNALRIASLSAAHVLCMFSSVEKEAKTFAMLWTLLVFLWPADPSIAKECMEKLSSIDCLCLEDRYLTFSKAKDKLFYIKELNLTEAILSLQALLPNSKVYILDNAFLSQLNEPTLQFLKCHLNLRELTEHILLEYSILEPIKVLTTRVKPENYNEIMEKWLIFSSEHAISCVNCPFQSFLCKDLLILPVIAMENGKMTRKWQKTHEKNTYFTLFPTEKDDLPLHLLTPLFSLLERCENVEIVHFSQFTNAFFAKYCNICCLWDTNSASALTTLDWLLREMHCGIENDRAREAFSLCLDTFASVNAGDHQFFQSLTLLSWMKARDGAYYRPNQLWIHCQSASDMKYLRSWTLVAAFPWKNRDWIEFLGLNYTLTLRNSTDLLINIASQALQPKEMDAMLHFYRFLARESSLHPTAESIRAIQTLFHESAVYAIACPETDVLRFLQRSQLVWEGDSTSMLTPLQSQYPLSLKRFFLEFCQVPACSNPIPQSSELAQIPMQSLSRTLRRPSDLAMTSTSESLANHIRVLNSALKLQNFPIDLSSDQRLCTIRNHAQMNAKDWISFILQCQKSAILDTYSENYISVLTFLVYAWASGTFMDDLPSTIYNIKFPCIRCGIKSFAFAYDISIDWTETNVPMLALSGTIGENEKRFLVEHLGFQDIKVRSHSSLSLPIVPFTLSEEERFAIGRSGEAFVYETLIHSHDNVNWVNQISESGLPYDIKFEEDGQTYFIEVKSTKSADKSVFEISLPEMEYAMKMGPFYAIYRVFQGSKAYRIVRFPDVIRQIRQKKLIIRLTML